MSTKIIEYCGLDGLTRKFGPVVHSWESHGCEFHTDGKVTIVLVGKLVCSIIVPPQADLRGAHGVQ